MIEFGMLRYMLPTCSTGARINHLREKLRPFPGETDEQFADRSYRKIRQASLENQCLTYQTCAACPRGARLVAEQKADEVGAKRHHPFITTLARVTHQTSLADLPLATGGTWSLRKETARWPLNFPANDSGLHIQRPETSRCLHERTAAQRA